MHHPYLPDTKKSLKPLMFSYVEKQSYGSAFLESLWLLNMTQRGTTAHDSYLQLTKDLARKAGYTLLDDIESNQFPPRFSYRAAKLKPLCFELSKMFS